MILDRRAYYNLIRISSLDKANHCSNNAFESWQLEDYRALGTNHLFERLLQLGIKLDLPHFHLLSDEYDTPEEVSENLLIEEKTDEKTYDQIYLIIFELWRRLVPEKQCLSIFCDEMDHLIQLYERDEIKDFEHLQDALANLQMILDENADQGADPKEVFNYINQGCASDLEAFLYDFIATQVDQGNDSYASELLDNFSSYVQDVKWFTLLKIRLLAISDPPAAKLLIRQMVRKAPMQSELDFNLEILSFLIQGGDRDVFIDLLKQTLPLIEKEEDFQDLLTITSDYFRCLDQDHIEKAVQRILNERESHSLENSINRNDPHFNKLMQIVCPRT